MEIQFPIEFRLDCVHCLSGRNQANLTGQRLKVLDIKWDKMIRSTMTRAQETGKIISTELAMNIPIENCYLIEEGAPIPPQPAVGHWHPEPSVRNPLSKLRFSADRR